MWPSSAPQAGRAAEDVAVDDHAAADAGAEREHQQVPGGAAVDQLGLGERGAVRVVVDEDRHAEAALELVAQRDALERDVHARDDGAGGEVDLGRHADADRRRLAVRRSITCARERLDAVEQRVRVVERGRGLLRLERAAVHDRGDLDLGPSDVDAEDLHQSRQPTRQYAVHADYLLENAAVDRRLAQRNLRTALIAGAIALILFGASFLAAEIYLS